MPLDRRTLATLRRAEFGFLGVTVVTFVHTPLLKGEGNLEGLFSMTLNPRQRAGVLGFRAVCFLGLLIN
jgi:hypothetical protein